MRTALSGTTPQDIPVKILAIVDGFYWGKLIMFESTDQAITDIGGIAAGMSGSPVYAAVDGPDPIVGAVSYGDSFTLHGTGLATPIEYMTALQGQFGSAAAAPAPAKAVRLAEPVVTSSGVVRRLVLGGEEAAASAAAGTSVVHPLAEAMITGLPSGSAAYKRLAARLEDGGLMVVSGEGAGAPGPTPPLEAGSPCGVAFSTGRYALTVLGTVTYADGDDVLLFGHPVLGGYGSLSLGLGQIEGTLTGATVDAVWPSAMAPYKMMTPADAKGVATQDRSAGVLARLGGSAPDFPVATHTSIEGGTAVDDVTDLGQWFAVVYWPDLQSPWGESPGITSIVAAAGLYHGLDSDPLVGSAATTTTVVVSDGSAGLHLHARQPLGQRRRRHRHRPGRSRRRRRDHHHGQHPLRPLRRARRAHRIRGRRRRLLDDAAARRDHRPRRRPGPALGREPGRGDLLPHGVDARRAPSARSSTCPRGRTSAARSWRCPRRCGTSTTGSTPRPKARRAGRSLSPRPRRSSTACRPTPTSSSRSSPTPARSRSTRTDPRPRPQTIVPSDWVVDGGVEKATASVQVGGSRTVPYRGSIRVSGYVRRTSSDEVAIYCREAGKPEPAEPTAVVPAVREDGMAMFGAVLPGYRHNVLVTAEVGAQDETSLPGADQFLVKVRARTRLAVSRAGGRLLLTARVAPADTDGSVTFQRLVHGRWVSAGSAKLDAGVAAVKARTATKVRARFSGGSLNAASDWVTVAVR